MFLLSAFRTSSTGRKSFHHSIFAFYQSAAICSGSVRFQKTIWLEKVQIHFCFVFSFFFSYSFRLSIGIMLSILYFWWSKHITRMKTICILFCYKRLHSKRMHSILIKLWILFHLSYEILLSIELKPKFEQIERKRKKNYWKFYWKKINYLPHPILLIIIECKKRACGTFDWFPSFDWINFGLIRLICWENLCGSNLRNIHWSKNTFIVFSLYAPFHHQLTKNRELDRNGWSQNVWFLASPHRNRSKITNIMNKLVGMKVEEIVKCVNINGK